MRSALRIAGWLLFGAGAGLAMLGIADLAGLMALPIDFGITLASKNDRVLWVIAWLVAAVLGLALAQPRGKRLDD